MESNPANQTLSNLEEIKVTDTSSTETTPEKPKSKRKFIIAGLIVTAFIVFAGVILIILQNNASSNIDVSSAKNSIESIDKFARASTIDLIDAIDVDKLDTSDPLGSMIDFDRIEKNFDSNINDAKYLQPTSFERYGETIHQAFDMDLELLNEGEQVAAKLTMDVYGKIDPNVIEEMYSTISAENALELLSNIDSEYWQAILGTDIEISGILQIMSETESISLYYQAVYVNSDLYLNIDNVEYSSNSSNPSIDKEILKQVQESTVKIESKPLFEMLAQSISNDVNADEFEYLLNQFSAESTFNAELFTESQEYQEMNELLIASFSNMSDEEIAQFKTTSNIILDELRNFILNTETISDYVLVDPIRESSDVQCYSGQAPLEQILDNGIVSIISVLEQLADSKEFADVADSQIRPMIDDIRAQQNQISSLLSLIGIKIEISACQDTEFDTLRGIGSFISFNVFGQTSLELKATTLEVDLNSDHIIEPLSEDMNITNDLLNLF